MRLSIFLSLLVGILSNAVYADRLAWSGRIDSIGTPSEAIPLMLNQKYQIKVSGSMNLGKWIQNGEKLANDACFEYSEKHQPSKLESLRNSLDISVCDGKYLRKSCVSVLSF